MKRIIKFGLVSLLSATIGLSACNPQPKKDKLEIEFNLIAGKLLNKDSVSVKVGNFRTYNGDTKVAHYFDLASNKWMRLELKYQVHGKDSLPLVSLASLPCEVSYDAVPGNPIGALEIIVDYDQGEEYALGVFGGNRSYEFQGESLKNAREWAEMMRDYFENRQQSKN